jgi:hypothetical protein
MSKVQGGNSIITDGLVLYLDPANRKSYPTSGITWTDLSKGGNKGTLINGVGYNSANGGTMVFDGINDYVAINNQIYNLSGGTLNIWVRRTGVSTVVVGSFGGSGDQRSPTFYQNSNNIGWEFGSLTSRNTGVAFTINRWFNICMTYNSNYNVNIYINGNLNTSQTSINPNGFWNQFFIGRYGNFGNLYFRGNISITQVYNRALTSEEVLRNFNLTRSRFNI